MARGTRHQVQAIAEQNNNSLCRRIRVDQPPEPRQFHATRKNSLPIAQESLGDQYSIAATPKNRVFHRNRDEAEHFDRNPHRAPTAEKTTKQWSEITKVLCKRLVGKQIPRSGTRQVRIYEPQLMIANSNKNIQHSYLQSTAKSTTESANIINTGQLDIQGYVGVWVGSHQS